MLEHANVPNARVAAIAISDANAARRITTVVREMNPNVHINVRTRYLKEVEPLYDLGANEVVPEEFETSLEIFARVLKEYLVPPDTVDVLTPELRSESYEALRKKPNGYTRSDIDAPTWNMEMNTIQVREGAALARKSIKETELRKKYGVTILLVKRGSETIYNPDADTRLMAGDTVFALGEPAKLSKALTLFSDPDPARS